MKSKSKINWDTVELVGPLEPADSLDHTRIENERTRALENERLRALESERAREQLFPDRRGRSIVKRILSGAAAKARARGARYTHSQLRFFIQPGLEMLIYSWSLVAAAVESDRDLSRGVAAAASAISAASDRLSGRKSV